ncbi:MATH domain-containing protein [Caenorhabditis elegans]|nr:MATH domain-containing protein [Caenorhabditis elegans]CCD64663.1 MATH domain-containing protein [Caenorhabditis elegans]|eukprot:NP_001254044.1 MATH (meprin-associated Traf homology) domain containing [Caenorhabditis elegans]
MCIAKCDDEFSLGLKCEKNNWDNREWSIETDWTMKLVSHNGKSLMESKKFTFNNSNIFDGGLNTSWDLLESDYVVDDSVVVEAHVKIIKITDLPCDEDEDSKTFLLSSTVRNISSIEEGDDYYTETTIRHNIPWRMQIKRDDGFFGLFLRCEKEDCEDPGKSWSIELDYELRLVSLNGQSLTFSDSDLFIYPSGEGFQKFMRWDDMEEKYMVNGSIIIEARGKITSLEESDDESSSENEEDDSSESHSENDSSSDNLEDEFSECVINVGGQNYTVKKQ